MTKRHFKALAEVLRAARQHFTSKAEWTRHCAQIALICASSNRAFDRGKFLQACGVI